MEKKFKQETHPYNPPTSELVKINEKFGSALLQEAELKTVDDIREAIVSDTKLIMADRELALEWEARNREAAKFCGRKLEAIQKGKFQIVRKRIVFNEGELNSTMSAYINRIP